MLQEATQISANVYEHVNPPATIHFVIGTAGAMFTENAVDPKPAWNSLTFYEYGYVKATASDQYSLKWEWINSISGQSMDTVYIYKSQPNTDDNDDSTDKLLLPLTTIYAIVFGSIGAIAVTLLLAHITGCINVSNWFVKNTSENETLVQSPIHLYVPPEPSPTKIL